MIFHKKPVSYCHDLQVVEASLRIELALAKTI
jgi:hypothetical protein